MKKISLIVILLLVSCSGRQDRERTADSFTAMVSDNNHSIIILTNNSPRMLDRCQDCVFQIIEQSHDKKWLIVTKMPDKIKGRVETEWFIYNTHSGKKLDSLELRKSFPDVYIFYGFKKINGKCFLMYENADSEEKNLNMKLIDELLKNK